MKKVKTLIVLGVGLLVAACTQQQFDQFTHNLTTGTQDLVQLNDALIQVNITLVNDFVAQQKLLAPYVCGTYNLGSSIVQGSPVANSVNNYIAKHVALGLASVAVSELCTAAGCPATVKAPANTPTLVVAPGQ